MTDVKKEPSDHGMSTSVSRVTGGDEPTSIDSSPLDGDVSDVIERIIGICKESDGQSVTERALKLFMKDVDTQRRLQAVNSLLAENKIKLAKKGNDVVYILCDDNSNESGSATWETNEERVVYDIIKQATNKGIWRRDISTKTGLAQQQLTKVLKSLESRNAIKTVTSVAQGRKKVYMLTGIDPDTSVTGGLWYGDDQDFDLEYVRLLADQCQRFLDQRSAAVESDESNPRLQFEKSYLKAQEVLDYISELKISRVAISLHDIETILDSLVFDGLAEKKALDSSRSDSMTNATKYYRSRVPSMAKAEIVLGPCHYCPVISDCRHDSPINPISCTYYQQWLNW